MAVEEFRERSEPYQQLASRAQTPEQRRRLERMARSYEAVADADALLQRLRPKRWTADSAPSRAERRDD